MTVELAEDFTRRKEREPLPIKWAAKDIGRQGRVHRLTEARTFMVQSNLPEKVYVFERVLWERWEGNVTYNHQGLTEYRIGYYIVGKNGNKAGRWTCGQFSPLVPIEDFWRLLALARKQGTLLGDPLSN